MTINIRKFEKQDLRQVLKICRFIRDYHIDVLGGYFNKQNDKFEQLPFLESLENDKILALVAEENNKIVGLILAVDRIAPHLTSQRIVAVENICVIETMQKSGIGKMLMDEIYNYCKIHGIKEIKLGVFNDNKKAYDFYTKYGFNPLEQRMNLYVK